MNVHESVSFVSKNKNKIVPSSAIVMLVSNFIVLSMYNTI